MEADRTARREFGAIEPLAAGLAVAVGVELLVLRTFTRTAVHIPGIEALAGPYSMVADFGRFAYYLSVVLLIAAMPVLAWRLWVSGEAAARLAAAVAAAFMVAAAGARAGVVDGYWIDTASIGAVLLLLAAAPSLAPWRQATIAGFFAVAFVLSGAHTLAQTATVPALRFDGSGFLTPAEVAAMVFGLATPLMLGRWPARREWVSGIAAAAVTFALFAGNPWTTRILLLWSAGLSGTFPAVVYGAAAGAFTVTIVALLREGRRLETYGLLLLLGGGIGLHSTYQTGLVVAGMALFLAGASTRRWSRPNPRVVATDSAQRITRSSRSALISGQP